MDVREKLVELIQNAKSAMKSENLSCDIERNMFVVDFMMANGVTVHEWIPVTERLPEEGDYVLCVLKGFKYGGKIQVCKFVPADKFKDKPYFEHFRNGFPFVTHWMTLPEPPKGE